MKILQSLGCLKLQHKLLLLVFFPLVIVLLYAVFMSVDRVRDLNSARDVLHLAKTTELLNIVHKLQFERGVAVNYVSNKKLSILSSWMEAQGVSDRFIAQLPALKSDLMNEKTNLTVLNTLIKLENNIGRLGDLRKALEDGTLKSRIDVQARYSNIIDKIHDSVSLLLNLAPKSEIFQLASALTTAAEMKEIMGQERALVTVIINRGQATNNQIKTLLELQTKHDFLSKKFYKIAPLYFQDAFAQLQLSGGDVSEANIVHHIVDGAPGTLLSVDANRWFNFASQRINGLREIEKDINQSLVDYAQDSRNQAYTALVFTILIAAATFILVVGFAIIATNRMTEGVVELRNAALRFTQTGELKSVAVRGGDELGDLARAFNQLIAQLVDISGAAETVAKGDFSAHIDVKSEQDRMAKSMNHMVATLRDTVQEIRSENWVKTGLNELAARVNNNEDAPLLTSKAISFLAEHVHAQVAAIYLVDNQNVASMSATYAFTHRKEVHNTFALGEGIVGQVVQEKAPMTLSDVPHSYMRIESGLGYAEPKVLVVIPLMFAGDVVGVMEFGFIKSLSEAEFDFLLKCGERLGVAINAAINRDRMAELLTETQAQATELQSQQRQLETANTNLEIRREELEKSQKNLNQQKHKLSVSNDQLRLKSEELVKQNREIEARSHDLERAKKALELKAQELRMANKYKSEFLANMSHELRSPLNSLLLLAQSLKENDGDNLSQQQLEAAGIIYDSGKSLLTLINDILDLSKVEAGKLIIEPQLFSVCSLIDTLRQEYEPQAKNQNLILHTVLHEGVPENICTDVNRVQQILRNLLSNAIKFTEEGDITLSVEPDSSTGVRFIVQDSGQGIPKSLQDSIFEAFQQGDGSTIRRHSGTGLGLTISRDLAQLLGGTIQLESEEGRGAKFILHLPSSALHTVPSDTQSINDRKDVALISNASIVEREVLPSLSASTSLNDKTILIVDDDMRNTFAVANLLKKKGAKVILADNGKLALKKIDENHQIEIVIVDLMMPDMDGFETIQAIREKSTCKNIPVVVLSAKVFEEDRLRCFEIGANDFLAKPVDSNHLLKSLYALTG